jgi:signal transduction histidine kinase
MEEPLRILMLEDLEEDAGLIDRALKRENISFVRTRVDTREEFIDSLYSFSPNIILSDHSLPQFNSIEALEICKERKIKLPFILVTGAVSEEFAVTCLKMGADDYVLKTNLSRLPQAIILALRKHWSEESRISQEDALRRQNEELIKINKEMDAFVYRVSHDLRSPLSSVLGLINVGRLEGSDEKAAHYFELIEASVIKLDETLQNILDYYKNSRGDLIIKEINLEGIVRKSFEQLKFVKNFDAIRKEISVHQQAEFHSDEYRLSVIILNLLSNAVRYTDDLKEDKFIEVVLNITNEYARVEVIDNGIGIPVEISPRIFDMFYRGTQKSQGAGLGLYIVKEMIEKLNGTISVASENNVKTLVVVEIPNHTPS